MILTHYDEPQAVCRCCGEAESAYLPQCKDCGYCPQCCECGTFTDVAQPSAHPEFIMVRAGSTYGSDMDENTINDLLNYEAESKS